MTEQDQDPIAAFTGESSQVLTRDERAMQRLQDWLARPLWSGACNPVGPLPWPVGVCILSGIDPEASLDADPAGWALLPGALEFYGFRSFPRDGHEAMQLGVAAEEQIGLLIGLGLKTAKPDRWIDRVQREGIPIPWQEARMRAAQSKRRRTQHETEDAVKLLNDMGRDKFDEIRSLGYEGFRFKTSDEVNASAVAHAIHEALGKYVGWDGSEPEKRTVRKYVAAWLTEGNA